MVIVAALSPKDRDQKKEAQVFCELPLGASTIIGLIPLLPTVQHLPEYLCVSTPTDLRPSLVKLSN